MKVTAGRDSTEVNRLKAVIDASGVDLLAYLERRVDTADAADLLADVLVIAWRRVRDVPAEPERARMWMFVVARNVVANHERGKRRQHRLAEKLREALESETPLVDGEHIDVRNAVAALEPNARELVRLIHWDGFSIGEAASILKINASTARTRYSKARTQLRATLGIVDS